MIIYNYLLLLISLSPYFYHLFIIVVVVCFVFAVGCFSSFYDLNVLYFFLAAYCKALCDDSVEKCSINKVNYYYSSCHFY